MAQVTALSPLGTPGPPYAFVAKAATTVIWTSTGPPYKLFRFTAANWRASPSWYAEAMVKATAGTARMRIWNETDGAAVADSEITTTSATFVRLRSAAATLTDGKDFRIQFGALAADGGEAYAGVLIHF